MISYFGFNFNRKSTYGYLCRNNSISGGTSFKKDKMFTLVDLSFTEMGTPIRTHYESPDWGSHVCMYISLKFGIFWISQTIFHDRLSELFCATTSL